MKIGSINIMGLRSIVKEEIYNFFHKNELDVCCIQETKIEEFSDTVGMSLWKSGDVR